MKLQTILVAALLLPGAVLGAGPELVEDLGTAQELDTGSPGFLPLALVTLGEKTLFVHNDGITGFELWSTDGTTQGTSIVRDICPGDCSGVYSAQAFVKVGPRAYFVADDGLTGNELWQTDGTTNGTRRVADLSPEPNEDSSPIWLTPFGDRLVFVMKAGDAPCSLMVLEGDGIDQIGSFPCDNVHEGPADLTPMGDRVFFSAATGEGGRELWATDGAPEGTGLFLEIAPGSASGLAEGSHLYAPTHWLVHGSRLFFPADDGTHGTELWSSDGTPEGTSMVADLEPGAPGSDPGDLAGFGEDLLFVATTSGSGREIWRLPHSGGAPILLEIATGSYSAQPLYLGETSAGAFFRANRSDTGIELFLTDGTPAGTRLVSDIRPGTSHGLLFTTMSRDHAFVEGDALLFGADDGETGREIWRSDGTPEGTVLVRDANPGPESLLFRFLRPLFSGPVQGDRHLFFGMDPDHGWEPRITDGSGLDFSLLGDFDTQTSIQSCFPQVCTQIVSGGARLLFPAFDWHTGTRPLGWAGAAGGARFVRPLDPGGQWVLRFPQFGLDLAAWADGEVFFPAGVDFMNDEAWITDGTDAGTHPLSDVASSVPESQPRGIASQFGYVYIAYRKNLGDGEAEDSLWRSDGTAIGTVKVGPYLLAVDHSAAPVESLFLLSEAEVETTLWELEGPHADPTELTTLPGNGWTVVAEIPPGPSEERVLFLAERVDPGSEERRLWSWTDSRGSRLLSETFRFAHDATSFLTHWGPPVAILGRSLVFVARDADTGVELWITDGTASGTHRLGDLYPGPRGSHPRWFATNGPELFFSAYEPSTGREVWRTDGTREGTRLGLDLIPGAASSNPRFLTALEEGLLFAARTENNGVELLGWPRRRWAKRTILWDIFPGTGSSSPSHLTFVAGRLFFFANDGERGFELWSLLVRDRIFEDRFESGDLSAWSSGSG